METIDALAILSIDIDSLITRPFQVLCKLKTISNGVLAFFKF